MKHTKQQLKQMLIANDAAQTAHEAKSQRDLAAANAQLAAIRQELRKIARGEEPADVIERAHFRVNRAALVAQLQQDEQLAVELVSELQRTERMQTATLSQQRDYLEKQLVEKQPG